MQFVDGAKVYDSENQEVGRISHVVVNPKTDEVTHIVIHKGLIFPEDKVVPIHLFVETTPEKAVLYGKADKLKSMQNFEDPEYTSASIADDIGLTGARHSYVTRVTRNIPDGTIALKEGARVISLDKQHVGSIENVIVNPGTDALTHFVISQGLLLKTRKVVPMSTVAEVEEDEVHLSLSAYDLENLPDY